MILGPLRKFYAGIPQFRRIPHQRKIESKAVFRNFVGKTGFIEDR